MARTAVILFNLGGPDNLDAVKPFLRNLFSDPAIIRAPAPIRRFLSWYISTRRAAYSRGIYAKIGGSSPIRLQTEKQARALEQALADMGEVKAFPSMRYWHPFSDQVAKLVADFNPDQIVLLPLYPQFSTTTSGSSLADWRRAAQVAGLSAPERTVCCYAQDEGFIAAEVELILPLLQAARSTGPTRLLLSAHGLPKKIIDRGDPYQWQIEQTARAIVAKVKLNINDWVICYQSLVGPLEWIGPSLDEEIKRASEDSIGIIVLPIAFVSEHSETLVELDIEYRNMAKDMSIPYYGRVPAIGTHPSFILGLEAIVNNASKSDLRILSGRNNRICPVDRSFCNQAGNV